LILKLSDEVVYCIVNIDKGVVEDFSKPLRLAMSDEEEVRLATDIVKADPRVKDLLDDGAIIEELSPADSFSAGGSLDGTTTAVWVCGASGFLIDNTTPDVREWYVHVDLSKEKVTDIMEWSDNYTIPYPPTGPFPAESIREITRIVEYNSGVWYLMCQGASIVGIEPLRDWGCRESGMEFFYNSSTPVNASECPGGVLVSYAKVTLALGNETCIVLVDPGQKHAESVENNISLPPGVDIFD
jgi:hypothetical protein